MPRISAIIPTYNRARLLQEAVDSVLAQRYRDFELIVVDDGSTDDTPALLEELLSGAGRRGRPGGVGSRAPGVGAADLRRAPGRPPIRVVRQRHTGFPGAVRNRGVAESTGELLAFLDADDLWEPEKLERQVARFDEVRARDGTPVLCHTRERWLRNGAEVSQKGQRHAREGWVFPDALVKCIIGPSTTMLRRSVFEELGGFREDVEIGEDYELWLRLTARYPVSYIEEPLTVKRAGHGDQLSGKYPQIESFRIRVLEDLVTAGTFADTPEYDSLARAELARKCRIYARGARKRGREAEAQDYEARAVRAVAPPA
jgi:glycosyltransferase involved in cell wall biosynthesis